MEPDDHERSRGIAALSLPSRIAVALGVAAATVAATIHIVMMFLQVTPSNTVTKQHGAAVDDYVYPEFEQNWKLFAPNPLQQNVAVQARTEVRRADGRLTTGDWIDLSARDAAAIRHNVLPSHTQQNELRRAWDAYLANHDAEDRPNGLRGDLTERYLRRVVLFRLGAERDGGAVQRVQVRSATTNVAPPPWSDEKTDLKPAYHELAWWPVTTADLPEAKNR
ncbi:DUF5819 family protein [Streptomyces varsoviensis]|uniref:Membrane protein n=1 Tax=Streptomyces varsoviensis TaxID=67373 RepID=A0ABR5J355_9ACTN|nr:DUF5819 family protein [Streptomyces varsoviensis]KOG87837.1 membrane protein [Streptomyces varsoviensis]